MKVLSVDIYWKNIRDADICSFLKYSKMVIYFFLINQKGGINITTDKSIVKPIYDDKILNVLERKKRIRSRLDIEINDIENFINDKCKDVVN